MPSLLETAINIDGYSEWPRDESTSLSFGSLHWSWNNYFSEYNWRITLTFPWILMMSHEKWCCQWCMMSFSKGKPIILALNLLGSSTILVRSIWRVWTETQTFRHSLKIKQRNHTSWFKFSRVKMTKDNLGGAERCPYTLRDLSVAMIKWLNVAPLFGLVQVPVRRCEGPGFVWELGQQPNPNSRRKRGREVFTQLGTRFTTRSSTSSTSNGWWEQPPLLRVWNHQLVF